MHHPIRFFKTTWVTACLCLASLGTLWGQTSRITLSGTIKDAKNGESLIGATVLAKGPNGNTGAVTNTYGFYSISVPPGSYTVTVQFVSYATKTFPISLTQPKTLDAELTEEGLSLQEVVIKAEKQDDNITRNQVGVEKINIQAIKTVPVLFGEQDVLKTIQLLPGVKSAGEGQSGFFVRGGAADQNLILLDGAPVYNASHLLGFFSVFNSDALKDATLYKGGIPAEFGGRTSSVLDIHMKEGNSKQLSVSGGIGLISSRLTVEAPIKKDKGSFIISGRRTYADLFLKLSRDSTVNQNKLYFYDLNAKANYKLGEKDWIYASGYFGTDKLGFGNSFGIDWGNATGTLRWNHIYNPRLFSNTSLIYSNYRYNINVGEDEQAIKISSRIQDWNLKQDYEYYLNDRNTLKFGWNLIHHTIVPGEVTAGSEASIGNIDLSKKYGYEGAAYVSNETKFSERLMVKYGLRLSGFQQVGPSTIYTYNPDRSVASRTEYGSGEGISNYFNLEPRASLNYIINPQSSIKFALERNAQYLHLLSNSTATNPTDQWIMSSNNVKPQLANQISAGYFRNFADNKYEFSTEAYYKTMSNQIDYRNGAELRANQNVEADLVYGDGRAYGLEFSLKKKTGNFTGWLSYTLSRTERRFDEINNGSYFPARQDRTHDIALVGTYQLSPKLILSGNFIYYTGNAITYPTGKYSLEGRTISLYSERNSYRMPNYHRLDLGLTWIRRKTATAERSWNFSVYNTYGRENAYTVDFRENENDPSRLEAVQTALFRWVPSVTYNFKF
jgi:hypothetical protein